MLIFSYDLIHTSQGEDDDLLVYTLALPAPAPMPPLKKPLITQVYSRCQHPPISGPPPAASTLDPILNDDLPIALKVNFQCAHPISSFCSYDHLSSHSCFFIASLVFILLPNKVSEGLAHLGWRSVMIEEMNVLTDNDTWEDLVCLPVGKKAISCRWVFTVQVNPD